MKGFFPRAVKALPYLLLLAAFAAALLIPVCSRKPATASSERVLTIWNVDTFEGGRGSRTAFLQRAARLAEGDGVFFRVLSYTAEGAEEAMRRGTYPHLISFGIGIEIDPARCIPMWKRFAGSSLALPWCRGGYALFCMEDDFERAGGTVISVGGRNLSCAAAYFSDVDGVEEDSLSAYLDFLGGKYRYLLGTQRDVNRFASRGVQVYMRPLPAYCDLYQYIAVLSAEEKDVCMRFVDVLLSDEVQGAVSEIGMLPADGAEGLTADIFSPCEDLEEAARALRSGDVQKIPEKFFKSI